MKEGEAKCKTPILRFNREKGEWVTYRDCEFLQNLKFAGREFYLVYKNGCFFICTDKGDDLVSVYLKKEMDGGYKTLPGEVVSEFRKKYLKLGVTSEMFELFLDNPVKYQKKYGKKQPTRK